MSFVTRSYSIGVDHTSIKTIMVNGDADVVSFDQLVAFVRVILDLFTFECRKESTLVGRLQGDLERREFDPHLSSPESLTKALLC